MLKKETGGLRVSVSAPVWLCEPLYATGDTKAASIMPIPANLGTVGNGMPEKGGPQHMTRMPLSRCWGSI